MTLGDRQRLLVDLLGLLYAKAKARGWKFTLGDGNRPDGRGHAPRSLHYIRLAQDLNLFVGKAWISTAHPAWNELGKYWKSLHPLARWGGDFGSKDYNHFSVTFEGRALRPVARGFSWFPVTGETACMTPGQKGKATARRKMLAKAAK